MSLTDFFGINLPYGMKKNSNGEWFTFNREYVPLGWNSTSGSHSIYVENPDPSYPVYTKYKGLTDNIILTIIKDTEAIIKMTPMKLTVYSSIMTEQIHNHIQSYGIIILRSLKRFQNLRLLGKLGKKRYTMI